MTRKQALTSLTLYRWTNPRTTCDAPFLAVATDRSVLLTLGDYRLSFEWRISAEAAAWLTQDFAPTGDFLACDFSTLRQVLDTTLEGRIDFGLVAFDAELRPNRLELSLRTQAHVAADPEYLIESPGSYQRLDRALEKVVSVSAAERVMLEVCAGTFAELAGQHRAVLTEPLPPGYRPS